MVAEDATNINQPVKTIKMKNVLVTLTVLCFISLSSCTKDDGCGSHNGKELFKGPEGGCYYINSNDNKTYVEDCECNC